MPSYLLLNSDESLVKMFVLNNVSTKVQSDSQGPPESLNLITPLHSSK